MPKPLERLGPYEIRDLIGRGGMGAVYLGLECDTRKRVAIKVLSPLLGGDESFRERFEAEIKSLETLKHPNVVELFGYGEENGHLFYAMELVDGKSLEEEIAKGRLFGWREVIRITVEVCSALKHAHDHGIIHRDIKPANLLLSPRNEIKLSDFGIAKLFGNTQMTAIGGVVGTADYMAPEQAEGLPATTRCDLYSLGGVMYALLAGRAPFVGKSLPEVIHKVRFEPALPVRRFSPDTPEALEQIVDQLLRKNPADRIPTALALSKRLLAIRHALTVNPPDERLPPPRQKTDGNPTMIDGSAEADVIDLDHAQNETAVMPTGEQLEEDGASERILEAPIHESVTGVADPAMIRKSRSSPDTKFTFVDEDTRRRARHEAAEDEIWWLHYARLGGLLFALISLGAILWIVSRPPSVDALFYEITTAAGAESTQRLLDAEAVLDKFIERFPEDSRTAEVRSLKVTVNTERLARRLELRARKKIAGRRLSPLEEILLESIRLEPLQPERAVQLLESLIDVYGDQEAEDEDVRQAVELSRRRLEEIQSQLTESQTAHAQLAGERLDHAKELAATDPQAARKILEALIILYGDKSWAEKLGREAELLLEEIGN